MKKGALFWCERGYKGTHARGLRGLLGFMVQKVFRVFSVSCSGIN